MANYANASKDMLPREGTHVTEGRTELEQRSRICWPVAFRPFLDDRVSVNEDWNDLFENAPYYSDPARPKDNHRIHYVTNAMPMVERGVVDTGARNNYWRRRGPENISRMPYTSGTLYLTEFSDDADLAVWTDIQRHAAPVLDTYPTLKDLLWSQPYDIWDVLHITPNSTKYRISSARHGNGGNAMYLDGHAATVKRQDLENIDTWDDHDYGVRDEAPPYAFH